MNAVFDRDALLDAFDQIGRAAVAAGTKLQIAVYGGSALMLASNFRFATEDVDVSQLEHPLPAWLDTVLQEIAEKRGWQRDWFNAFHLSSLADRPTDHLEFATLPRMARKRDLWFQFHRQNICWRSNSRHSALWIRFAVKPSVSTYSISCRSWASRPRKKP